MKNRKRAMLAAAIGLALLVQLMNPARAYADGETTPPPAESPTPEPTDPVPNKPGVDLIPTEALDTEPPEVTSKDPLPPRVDPVEPFTPTPPIATPDSPDKPAELEASTPTPGPTASELTNSPRVPTLGDALRGLPENTVVIVLDNIGKPLPLASQEAAQVITESDPVWCPTGQVPTPGANGCTVSYATLADLVANEGANIAADGMIWITSGPVADTSPVTIDGSIYTNWANYTLQLEGGWSGISGDASISSNSVFSVPITIANWNNFVSLTNLTTETLNIQSPHGVVILANVETQNTYIDNPTGRIDVYGSRGNLHVNNADINNSGLYSAGINIHTLNGNVSIQNSIFHGNGYDGVWMENVNNVFIENSQFYENWNNGIGILNAGAVTVSNSSFFGNWGNGMVAGVANAVTISNSTFNSNSYSGLSVDTAGNATLNSVTGSLNGIHGMWVNAYAGNITASDLTANNNSGVGLIVTSSGDSNLNNITANNNFQGTLASTGYGSVTMTGRNEFLNNGFSGLQVSASNGEVSLSQVTVQNNLTLGLEILGAGNITLNNITADHNGTGVSIVNAGNVTLSGGILSNNSVGLQISCVMSVNFTVKPVTVFTGNITPISIDPACPINVVPPQSLTLLKVQGKLFTLDCATGLNRFVVRLANGDRGEIFCPVEGQASIDRVDNTTLPASLPVGYTYASAFDVKILQNNERIDVIREGGYVTASFLVQDPQGGSIYSILYWDEKNGTWIPLKELLLNEKGNAQSFALYPGIAGDEREIRTGVHLVTKNGESRVEVSTNFPGIFVLAQQ